MRADQELLIDLVNQNTRLLAALEHIRDYSIVMDDPPEWSFSHLQEQAKAAIDRENNADT